MSVNDLNTDMDAVVLMDVENAMSSINRKVIMLLDLRFICPMIAIYIINCYPSRLFNQCITVRPSVCALVAIFHIP